MEPMQASSMNTARAQTLFFVAGERSGDMHGAALIRMLRGLNPEVRCEGLGGELMAGAGMTLRFDLAAQAIMGFAEVLRHFPAIRRLMIETEAYLRETRPDALVLIDYPGFNLHLAQKAHALGIPVFYYISPQVWAWKKNRVHTMARCVRKVLAIFPFEEAFYRGYGVDCVYVGHPLLDRAGVASQEFSSLEAPIVGLLPGSRAQEISRHMQPMLEVAAGILKVHPGARFQAPCVDERRAEQIRAAAQGFPLEILAGGMESVLERARFCMVASGTATLETALRGVPMLVLYRVNPLSYALARLLVRGLQHIAMVNILAGKEVVPEFIQHRATAAHMLPAALELLEESPRRARMVTDLRAVRESLGGPGASKRAAREILNSLAGSALNGAR